MKYDKLVRDRIPERIKAKGEPVSFHVADEKEYWEKLKLKLAEEVAEFAANESLEEIADLYEVIDAIIVHKKFDRNEIADVKMKKATERGRFDDRIILEES